MNGGGGGEEDGGYGRDGLMMDEWTFAEERGGWGSLAGILGLQDLGLVGSAGGGFVSGIEKRMESSEG